MVRVLVEPPIVCGLCCMGRSCSDSWSLWGCRSRPSDRTGDAPRLAVISAVLAEREHVSVRILEPGDLGAAGRDPDAAFLVRDERVFLELDAARAQSVNRGLNVVHFPAKDGALQWSEARHFGNPNVVPADPHDQRELIEADKLEAELALVKLPRLAVVSGDQETDHLCVFEHSTFLFRRIQVS